MATPYSYAPPTATLESTRLVALVESGETLTPGGVITRLAIERVTRRSRISGPGENDLRGIRPHRGAEAHGVIRHGLGRDEGGCSPPGTAHESQTSHSPVERVEADHIG